MCWHFLRLVVREREHIPLRANMWQSELLHLQIVFCADGIAHNTQLYVGRQRIVGDCVQRGEKHLSQGASRAQSLLPRLQQLSWRRNCPVIFVTTAGASSWPMEPWEVSCWCIAKLSLILKPNQFEIPMRGDKSWMRDSLQCKEGARILNNFVCKCQ